MHIVYHYYKSVFNCRDIAGLMPDTKSEPIRQEKGKLKNRKENRKEQLQSEDRKG